MKKPNHLTILATVLISSLMITGCGKGGAGGSSSFDSAAPEVKSAWDKACSADQANDYVNAATGYKSILAVRDTLKPEQVTAVQEASGKLNQRLVDASTKGDANARQALNTLLGMERSVNQH